MIAALLLGLALTDVAFVGYRTAAGKNPLIDKRRYHARAVLGGVAAGLIPIAVNLAAVALLLATADDGRATYAELSAGGALMVLIYSVYAALVLLAFVPYLFAPLDLRVLASVAIFGPLTLLRPAVIGAAAAAAALATTDWRVTAAALVAAATMIAFEPILEHRRKDFASGFRAKASR